MASYPTLVLLTTLKGNALCTVGMPHGTFHCWRRRPFTPAGASKNIKPVTLELVRRGWGLEADHTGAASQHLQR